MRFTTEFTKPIYSNGETRLKRAFAWFPVRISAVIVWFEYYEILQVYRITKETVKIDGLDTNFLVTKWVNLANRCK